MFIPVPILHKGLRPTVGHLIHTQMPRKGIVQAVLSIYPWRMTFRNMVQTISSPTKGKYWLSCVQIYINAHAYTCVCVVNYLVLKFTRGGYTRSTTTQSKCMDIFIYPYRMAFLNVAWKTCVGCLCALLVGPVYNPDV